MRFIHPLLAAALGCALLSACSGGEETTNPDGLATVRVAVLPTVTKAPMYLAMEKGFFAEEGIEIEAAVVQDGAAVTAGVVSGSADFSSSALVPVVTAISKGVPVKIVTTAASTSEPTTTTAPYGDAVLMVKDGGAINTLSDLEGKTIAVNALQAGIELVVRGALERAGVDTSGVKFLAVPFPEMTTAAEQGRVDAIAPVEPFVTSATKAGLRTLSHTYPYDPAREAEFVNSVYFTSSTYAEENPEIVDGFKRAVERANAYAEKHPEEVRAQIVKYTGVENDVAEVIALPEYPSTRNDAAYQSEIELMDHFGWLDTTPSQEALFTP